MRTPPNEQRNFVHKRLIKAATGFVTSGFNPLAAAAGFAAPVPSTPKRPRLRTAVPRSTRTLFTVPSESLRVRPPGLRPTQRSLMRRLVAPVAPPVRRPAPRSTTARPSQFSAAEKESGRRSKFPNFSAGDVIDAGIEIITGGGSQRDCGPLRVWDEVAGKCVFGLGEQAGRDDTPGGDVVMGLYGAGEMPGNMVVNRAVCRPGMVIGDDGVCYNRSQIKNSQREWPRGRRPLLTGGDMRAISTAARAGRRLERTTKRLQKIGMMKKPAARARRLPPHQHQITSGG